MEKKNGRTIDKIELLARGQQDHVFKGFIYIVEGEWRIYSVDLQLTNLMENFLILGQDGTQNWNASETQTKDAQLKRVKINPQRWDHRRSLEI